MYCLPGSIELYYYTRSDVPPKKVLKPRIHTRFCRQQQLFYLLKAKIDCVRGCWAVIVVVSDRL